MFGSGATTGLRQTTTAMLRLAILKVLIAVSIMWYAAARGIGGNGVRVAFALLLVFDTISRVIHLAFGWFRQSLIIRVKNRIFSPRLLFFFG